MPDMIIEIGGREFSVSCQEGEEGYLNAAAELLDREAQTLLAAGSRMSQERMLLMTGLMLADKSISAEEELRTLDRRLAQQTQLLDEMRARPEPQPSTVEVVREIDRIPSAAVDRMEDLAVRAEALATRAAELRG